MTQRTAPKPLGLYHLIYCLSTLCDNEKWALASWLCKEQTSRQPNLSDLLEQSHSLTQTSQAGMS
jgi:hypothetical protein